MSNANFLNKLAKVRKAQKVPLAEKIRAELRFIRGIFRFERGGYSLRSYFPEAGSKFGVFLFFQLPVYVLVACGIVKAVSWVWSWFLLHWKVFAAVAWFAAWGVGIYLAIRLVIYLLRIIFQPTVIVVQGGNYNDVARRVE